MKKQISFNSVAEKLFDFILSNDTFQKTEVVKDALPFIEQSKLSPEKVALLQKALEEYKIDQNLDKFKTTVASCNIPRFSGEETHGKFDSFNFEFNGISYFFKRDTLCDIVIKVKPDETKIDSKYLSEVSKDMDSNKSILKEMAQVIPFYNIADTTYDCSVSSYMTVIFCCSGGVSKLATATERFFELTQQFETIYTPEEMEFINYKRYTNTKKADQYASKMFDRWIDFLKAGNYTATNRFVFNDLDNEAFIEENDKFILMSQKSQNTLFAYIKEKSTQRIKVFNYAEKMEFCDYGQKTFEQSKNYLELFKKLNNHYSYENYYFDFESNLYPRFFEYYLNHFETINNLVYDSAYGFNVRSHYINTLEEDFELLNSDFIFEQFEEENE